MREPGRWGTEVNSVPAVLEQTAQRNYSFYYLKRVWDDIKQYYPDGFDEKREYEDAMRERYGRR